MMVIRYGVYAYVRKVSLVLRIHSQAFCLPPPSSPDMTQPSLSLQSEVNRLKHELALLKKESASGDASEEISIGKYLLARLAQLGVTVSGICVMSEGLV